MIKTILLAAAITSSCPKAEVVVDPTIASEVKQEELLEYGKYICETKGAPCLYKIEINATTGINGRCGPTMGKEEDTHE